MFVRRGGGSERYLLTRITLGFLGAGIWVAGVVTANRTVTGAAIVIVFAAVLLGWLARYQENRAAGMSAGDEGDEEGGTRD